MNSSAIMASFCEAYRTRSPKKEAGPSGLPCSGVLKETGPRWNQGGPVHGIKVTNKKRMVGGDGVADMINIIKT